MIDRAIDIVEMENAFYAVMYKMAASPFIELMHRVFVRLYFVEPRNLLPSPPDRLAWFRTHRDALKAVLEGDEGYAQALSRRFWRRLRDAGGAAVTTRT